MNKAFLPYDVFERHKKVAQYISATDTVLDVGGELNHLSQFINCKKIIVANLNTGDVIIKKNKLPFKKDSFDVVCSIDVLEHIPANRRNNFIQGLVDISKKMTILSFPIGTSRHTKSEAEMLVYLKEKKVNVLYLEEHVKYGLPKVEEIEKYTSGLKKELYFSGNILLNELLFKLFIFDPKVRLVRKAVYFSKLFFNLVTNPIFYALLSSKRFSETVNRAYLIIHK